MNIIQPSWMGPQEWRGPAQFSRFQPQPLHSPVFAPPTATGLAPRLDALWQTPAPAAAVRAPQSSPLTLPSSRALTQARFLAPEQTQKTRNGEEAAALRLDAQSFQQRSQSTELSIRTRDGDVVTLRLRDQSSSETRQQVALRGDGEDAPATRVDWQGSASSAQAESLEALLGQDGVSDVRYSRAWSGSASESTMVQVNGREGQLMAASESQRYREGSLEFEVEGSLDAEELEAIRELVGGVKELSETFFDGDLKQAFDQALELGYDAGEIAGYSLELRDQQLSVEAQRYRAADALREPTLPRGLFRGIGNYAAKLQSFFELDQVALKGQLFEKLMEQIDDWRKEDEAELGRSDSFADFNRELLALTDALTQRN